MSELPPAVEQPLKQAIRLEYWNLFWTATIILAMGLVLGQSQTMKTAWVEDALGAIDGTWRLTVRQGRGAAERLGPAADAVGLGAGLRLDAARFSALWLGGHSRGAGAAVLAEAGVVAELRAGAATYMASVAWAS